MSLEKSAAIILRVVDFSNTSCIVTMYTRDFGKISALAKGARRSKSPFEAALDVLSICHVVFVHKSHDALDILTEAKLERRFRAAARDLSKLYLAYYFVELITALTEQVDPQPELYDLFESAIIGLDQDESNEDWMLRFEMRLLSLIGQAPGLDFCVSCGGNPAKGPHRFFSIAASGVMCGDCRPGKRSVVQVSEQTIETLNRFSRPDDSWKQGIAPQNIGEIRGIVNQYMAHVLGYRPKLFTYLAL